MPFSGSGSPGWHPGQCRQPSPEAVSRTVAPVATITTSIAAFATESPRNTRAGTASPRTRGSDVSIEVTVAARGRGLSEARVPAFHSIFGRRRTVVGSAAVPETGGEVDASRHAEDGGSQCRDYENDATVSDQLCKLRTHVVTSSQGLEPEVLQRLGGAPIESRCAAVVAAALREVALRDPCSCPVRAR